MEFVLKKILRSLGVRVGLCLKLCLIFQEIYPKYAYNRYAYRKKLVYHPYMSLCRLTCLLQVSGQFVGEVCIRTFFTL